MSTNLLEKIFHGVLDGMIRMPSVRYSDVQSEVSLSEWADICKLSRECIAIGCSNSIKEKLDDLCTSYPNLSKVADDILLRRHADVVQANLQMAAVNTGSALVDFDWQIPVVLGSDKLATIVEPLLAVTFTKESKESNTNSCIDVEFTENQLGDFIRQLEQIDMEMQKEVH